MERWDAAFADESAWFAPLRPFAARFARLGDWPRIEELNDRLAADAGVVFVEAAKLRPRRRRARPIDPESLYEVRIVRRGEVPTRPRSWHDFLNALVWAAFPASKLALTRRLWIEKEAQAREHVWRLPNRRTPIQDALALFDEGGAVAPVAGDVTGEPVIFGHAVYEHLISGRAPRVTNIRVTVAALPAARADLDAALAAQLGSPGIWPLGQRPPAVTLDTIRAGCGAPVPVPDIQ
jgi:Protein of unknown function (DUF3025)